MGDHEGKAGAVAGGQTVTCTAERADRLDRVLSEALPDLSRARIQGLIRDGQACIDGVAVTQASRKIGAGAQVTLVIPPAAPAIPAGEDIPLDIRYEDEDLVVIDKPVGLVVHPAGGHETGTLVNALIAHCGNTLSGIGGVARPGIVHRLDKDTSGLLVVAKNDAAHRGLAAQFADHGRTGPLERAYLAIVWGVPDRPRFSIDAPIARARHNREKMIVARGRGPSGETSAREAVTHVTVLEALARGEPERAESARPEHGGGDPHSSGQGEAALVRCELETGRTHQIRVHMAHIGHPLLGDALYGSGYRTKAARLPQPAREALDALGRQALHAALLGFAHPRTGVEMRFESEPPEDLARLLAALQH